MTFSRKVPGVQLFFLSQGQHQQVFVFLCAIPLEWRLDFYFGIVRTFMATGLDVYVTLGHVLHYFC